MHVGGTSAQGWRYPAWLLEQTRNRYQAAVNGIGSEAKALKGKHTEQRFRSGIAKDSDGGLDTSIYPDSDPGDVVRDLAAIRQHERPLLLGPNAEALEEVPRHPRIRGPCVNQCLDAVEAAAGGVPDLDLHTEAAHAWSLIAPSRYHVHRKVALPEGTREGQEESLLAPRVT